MPNDNISGIVQELRRGTIVLCALCKLSKPMYGYSLVTSLAESGVSVEANTLYPLLRRLEGQGLLESRWDTGEAKPRKYYIITEEGEKARQALIDSWNDIVDKTNTLIKEEQ